MFCPACGKQVNDEFQFCPHCGGALPRLSDSVPPMTQYYVGEREDGGEAPPAGAPSGAAPQTVSAGARAVVSDTPALGMKWYKFVIYVQLFLGVAGATLGALVYFVGQPNSLYYSITEGIQALDTLMGVLFVALAVLSVYVRMGLAHYRKDAPLHYLVLNGVSFALPMLYASAFETVANWGIGSRLHVPIDGVSVTMLLMGVGFIVANKRYFDRRAHLFVN